MMDALLRDDRLRWDLAQLAATLDQLLPGGLGDRFRFSGDEPLGLEGALEQIGRLQAMERLEDAARRTSRRPATSPRSTATRSATSSATTPSATSTRSTTSPAARGGRLPDRDGRAARADAARAAGGSARRCSTTCSRGSGATRSAAIGIDRAGRGGEREETTKPYEFGDPFHLDLRGRCANALAREENAPGRRAAGRGDPARRPTTSRSTAPSS